MKFQRYEAKTIEDKFKFFKQLLAVYLKNIKNIAKVNKIKTYKFVYLV